MDSICSSENLIPFITHSFFLRYNYETLSHESPYYSKSIDNIPLDSYEDLAEVRANNPCLDFLETLIP